MKKFAIGLALAVMAMILPASAANVSTRFELRNATTNALIPCGSTVSGVSVVRLKGYATAAQSGGTIRFRVGYGPAGASNAEAWYGLDPSLLSAQEKQVAEVAQDLIPGDGVHNFAFGTASAIGKCSVTFNNIPTPSTGETTARPLAADRVDELRILLFTYVGHVPIPCGSTANAGRIRAELQAKNVVGGWHTLHTHQEIAPAKGGNGPDQDGDGYDRRFWEKAAIDVWVPGGSVWTKVNDTLVAGVGPGNNTFHAAEGHAVSGGVETFCSFDKSGSGSPSR